MEVVKARLRKGKDEDIKEGMMNLPPHYDHSDVVRDALRLLLFGTTPKTYTFVEVRENQNNETFMLTKTDVSDEEIESNLDELIMGF
ncbi:hypothetical protein SAMN04487895_101483 [Paenibacillus sophorae]|uniref:Uncharacterized protein n=1 Tax=Paenibacillus sophorae TaxID=1333845 RepID=A0A1H8GES4_9BACL|nr:hypothetical protein [Paenibacillus sophorae]QWU14193.1 hypothetical protein KP014_19980 [Paenibacillus sophorae]SEN42309.1 hypothetical protein SAMN04487895_101483 [Paenibacillus sophorae]